jgi:hypothetical protein
MIKHTSLLHRSTVQRLDRPLFIPLDDLEALSDLEIELKEEHDLGLKKSDKKTYFELVKKGYVYIDEEIIKLDDLLALHSKKLEDWLEALEKSVWSELALAVRRKIFKILEKGGVNARKSFQNTIISVEEEIFEMDLEECGGVYFDHPNTQFFHLDTPPLEMEPLPQLIVHPPTSSLVVEEKYEFPFPTMLSPIAESFEELESRSFMPASLMVPSPMTTTKTLESTPPSTPPDFDPLAFDMRSLSHRPYSEIKPKSKRSAVIYPNMQSTLMVDTLGLTMDTNYKEPAKRDYLSMATVSGERQSEFVVTLSDRSLHNRALM